MNEVAVYDGRRCLGWIVERHAKRYEAYRANGEALGVFESRTKATTAICEAARVDITEAAA